MKFDIEKEREEIEKLNKEADENIKQQRELQKKMVRWITRLELLIELRNSS